MRSDLQRQLSSWFDSLPTHATTSGLPARGSIAACLVVLERLRTEFDLDLNSHRAKGGAQIRGLSAPAVGRILERYGETRRFLGEGGRTNRGTPADVESLLRLLNAIGGASRSDHERVELIDQVQSWLAAKVREYFDRQRLQIAINPRDATWKSIDAVLDAARIAGKAGAVAQYLVGAKLQLRFPELEVANEPVSAGDVQTGRLGDFEIGDTVFHVTTAPGQAVYEKCQRNIALAKRVCLLVPDRALQGARQILHEAAPGRVMVESLESFVANNLEEMALFSQTALVSGLRRLLEEYNRRVEAAETDRSLLIEIPRTLD